MRRPTLTFVVSVVLPFGGAAQAQTVTAADVVDQPSLRAFVERAADFAAGQVPDADGAYAFFDRTFRPLGEWREGAIYLYVMTPDGVNVFHATRRDIEGQNRFERQDKNGFKYIQEILRQAEAGGGFVEYFFDNPAIEGDEEEGSLKVAYAAPLSIGEGFVIVSGYYPADPVPVAPPFALVALATILLAGGAYRRRRRNAST